jgi:hypothetical protein
MEVVKVKTLSRKDEIQAVIWILSPCVTLGKRAI